jgi:hypothetical protein
VLVGLLILMAVGVAAAAQVGMTSHKEPVVVQALLEVVQVQVLMDQMGQAALPIPAKAVEEVAVQVVLQRRRAMAVMVGMAAAVVCTSSTNK